jgi:hypothetical protein
VPPMPDADARRRRPTPTPDADARRPTPTPRSVPQGYPMYPRLRSFLPPSSATSPRPGIIPLNGSLLISLCFLPHPLSLTQHPSLYYHFFLFTDAWRMVFGDRAHPPFVPELSWRVAFRAREAKEKALPRLLIFIYKGFGRENLRELDFCLTAFSSFSCIWPRPHGILTADLSKCASTQAHSGPRTTIFNAPRTHSLTHSRAHSRTSRWLFLYPASSGARKLLPTDRLFTNFTVAGAQ